MRSPYRAPAGLASDDAGLAELIGRPGPFVTLYLQVDPTAEPASATSEAHWRDVRRGLDASGAPPGALEAIDELVPEAHRLGLALGAVADASGLVLAEGHDEPITADRGRLAPLPALGPLLEWRERRLPHVIAVADRAGADLVAFGARGEPVAAQVGDPDRHDPMLHRVRSGGWSQRRYERRVEGRWEADAKQVAEAVAELADQVGAPLVLIGGDVRALELLTRALPASLGARVEHIPATRAPGGDDEATSEAIARLVNDEVARAHVAAFRSLEELSSKGLACSGAAATLEALSRGQVELLVVNDDPDDEREAWFATEPFVAALEPGPLVELTRRPVTGRLVDVAIVGALSSGAAVRVVPAAPVLRDGVGALLRFATHA